MPVVGTAPVKPCPQCQFRNKPSAAFCQNCGQGLSSPPSSHTINSVVRPAGGMPAGTSPIAAPVTKPMSPPISQAPTIVIGSVAQPQYQQPPTSGVQPQYQQPPTSLIGNLTQPNRQQLLFQLQIFAYGLIGLGSVILACLIFGPFVRGSLVAQVGSLFGSGMSSSFSAIHFLFFLFSSLFKFGFANGGIFAFFAIMIILSLPAYAILVIRAGSKLSKAIIANHLTYSINQLQVISGIILGFFGLIYALMNISLDVNSNVLGLGTDMGFGLGWGFTFTLVSVLVIFISCIWYKNTVLKLSVTL